jgi:hypothetical protein
VMVRGFAFSACARCDRTIELAAPDVDPLGLFLRPSHGLHELADLPRQAESVGFPWDPTNDRCQTCPI